MQNDHLKAELKRNIRHLRRFCHPLTCDGNSADDLLQDTIVRVLEKGMPDDADIRKWTFRICKNIWIDELRSRKVRRDWTRSQSERTMSCEDGERMAHKQLELNDVHTMIESLPKDQRLILSLVAVEGCTYREAAMVADVPQGTVMSRLSRARANLIQQRNSIEGE